MAQSPSTGDIDAISMPFRRVRNERTTAAAEWAFRCPPSPKVRVAHLGDQTVDTVFGRHPQGALRFPWGLVCDPSCPASPASSCLIYFFTKSSLRALLRA